MGLLLKLQNGDTALKSLKFGKDRPGGGDSGQPYIKDPILDNPLPESPDFLLRGGLNAPIDAAQDVARLTKYMFDLKSPSGLLFTAKQNLLSRVAPKTEAASSGIAYAGGILNEGVYTPLSTLAQAGVGFLGIHLNKQGIDPTGLIPGLSIRTYSDYISTQIFTDNLLGRNENSTNRLIKYWDRKITNKNISPNLYTYGGGPGSILGIGETKIRFATDISGNALRTGVNNTQIPLDFFTQYGYDDYSVFKSPRQLYYQGAKIFNGKAIVNGKIFNGKTVSGLYETLTGIDPLQGQFNTTNGSTTLEIFPTNVYTPFSAGTFPENELSVLGSGSWTQQDFINVDQINKGNPIILEDFRKKLPKSGESSTFLQVSEGYSTGNNIETLFHLGNPGQKGDISNFTTGKKDLITKAPIGPADKINAYPIYKSSETYKNGLYSYDPSLNDLIPFYIAILNNEDQTGGPYKKYLHFRAFIDSFSDSYDADWNSLQYMGRAEKFYRYKGFDRKISMAFTVAAQSQPEINGMYDKLNFLASSLAPEYLDSSASGYMAGNIAYITLGQYIVNQPGIITSLTYDVPEESSWDIARDNKGNITTDINDFKAPRQVPYIIRVTGFNFIPLHKFRAEKQTFSNDTLGTDSTALIQTGLQRYLDQSRPASTNYDAEFFQRNFNSTASFTFGSTFDIMNDKLNPSI